MMKRVGHPFGQRAEQVSRWPVANHALTERDRAGVIAHQCGDSRDDGRVNAIDAKRASFHGSGSPES
jgi:hypothetical protein